MFCAVFVSLCGGGLSIYYVNSFFFVDFLIRSFSQKIELCAIRDGLSTCNTLSHTDVCHLIELIYFE